jgi:hypothetical protein
MCDFSNLSDEQKEQYHRQLNEYAQSIGGVNFFLQLLEAIRETNPHPLTSAHREFVSGTARIKWNKVIFQDKLQLLIKARENEGKNGNLLPKKEAKGFKKILNLLRTMKPIVFTVTPAHREEGNGFFFQPLERMSESNTKLNFVFEILFFCSAESAKKILNYKAKN